MRIQPNACEGLSQLTAVMSAYNGVDSVTVLGGRVLRVMLVGVKNKLEDSRHSLSGMVDSAGMILSLENLPLLVWKYK